MGRLIAIAFAGIGMLLQAGEVKHFGHLSFPTNIIVELKTAASVGEADKYQFEVRSFDQGIKPVAVYHYDGPEVDCVAEVRNTTDSSSVMPLTGSPRDYIFEVGRVYEFSIFTKAAVSGSRYAVCFARADDKVQVAFDGNGGSVTNEAWKTHSYQLGAPYGVLPDAVNTNRVVVKDDTSPLNPGGVKREVGYDFAGWYTEPTNGVLITTNTLACLGYDKLYAHWVTNSVPMEPAATNYFVHFYPNKGLWTNKLETVVTQEFAVGVGQALASNEFTRAGHLFMGWMEQEAGEVKYADGQVVTNLAVAGSIKKLYASWQITSAGIQTQEVDGVVWHYSVEDGKATIQNVDDVGVSLRAVDLPMKTYVLAIPRLLGTNEVTAIGKYAFAGCDKLVEVDIPETITMIDNCAFADCRNLSPGITVPESVVTLGASVFTNCTALKIVRYLGNIPKSVSDNVYAGTPQSMVTGCLRLRDGWENFVNGTNRVWKSRTIAWWTGQKLLPVTLLAGIGCFDGDPSVVRRILYYVPGRRLGSLPAPSDPEHKLGDPAYVFDGWYTKSNGGEEIPPDQVVERGVTLYAHWHAVPMEQFEDGFIYGLCPNDDTTGSDVARGTVVYNGYIMDREGRLCGTLKATVAAEKNAYGAALRASTVKVMMPGVTNRIYRGTMVDGNVVPYDLDDDAGDDGMFILFGVNGMAGSWGDWEIQGARETLVRDVGGYSGYTGYWTLKMETDYEDASSEWWLTLKVGNTGSVKVEGSFDTGVAVGSTVQMIMGDGEAVVPVTLAVPGTGKVLYFLVHITPDEEDIEGTISVDDGVWRKPGMPTETDDEDASDEVGPIAVSGEGSRVQPIDDIDCEYDSPSMVGVAFSGQFTVGSYCRPVKFSATGLPPGLKVDPSTGKITGVPTKAGVYNFTGKAVSQVYGGAPVLYPGTIEVLALPAWAQGSFAGTVKTADGQSFGAASMTVGTTGKISGKFLAQGTNWTFSAASYYEYESSTDKLHALATAKHGREEIEVTLEVSCPPEAVEADLDASVAEGGGRSDSEMYVLTMRRNIWGDANVKEQGLVADFLGMYTAQVEVENMGCGYLSVKMDAKGNAKLTGKMPDGVSVSASSFLLYDAESSVVSLPIVFSSSAWKGGSASVELVFSSDELQNGSESGSWLNNSPTATGIYDEGFLREFTVRGARFDKAYSGYTPALFIAEAPSMVFTQKTKVALDERRTATISDSVEVLAAELDCWTSLWISPNATGTRLVVDEKVTRPVYDRASGTYLYEGGNDAALSFSYTAASGVFKGAFTCWYDYASLVDEVKGSETMAHSSKVFRFEGVVLQESNEFCGFALVPRTGVYIDAKTGRERTFTYNESIPVEFR